jgi:bacterioferritin-associated ferredoxin
MTDTEQYEMDDVICPCSGTTPRHIMKLVERGMETLDDISKTSGACSGCGGCESDMMAFLKNCLAARTLPHDSSI